MLRRYLKENVEKSKEGISVVTFPEVHDGEDGAAAGLSQLIGRHAGVQAGVAGAAVPDPQAPRVLGL